MTGPPAYRYSSPPGRAPALSKSCGAPLPADTAPARARIPAGHRRASPVSPVMSCYGQWSPGLLSDVFSSGGNTPNCWPGGASGLAGGGAYGPLVDRGGAAGGIVPGGEGIGVKRRAPVGRIGAELGDEYDDGREVALPEPRSRSMARSSGVPLGSDQTTGCPRTQLSSDAVRRATSFCSRWR